MQFQGTVQIEAPRDKVGPSRSIPTRSDRAARASN